MVGRFLGLPWFPANPTCGVIVGVLGGTFSPSCRSSDDDGEEESAAQGSRQTHDNLYRVHMPSLYSCGSSYGSETSIPAAAHTVSNAPVTEYMWVSWPEGCIVACPGCFSLTSVFTKCCDAGTFNQAVESNERFRPKHQKAGVLIGIYWEKGIAWKCCSRRSCISTIQNVNSFALQDLENCLEKRSRKVLSGLLITQWFWSPEDLILQTEQSCQKPLSLLRDWEPRQGLQTLSFYKIAVSSDIRCSPELPSPGGIFRALSRSA